jgi:Tfp pilus assembly protein PilO
MNTQRRNQILIGLLGALLSGAGLWTLVTLNFLDPSAAQNESLRKTVAAKKKANDDLETVRINYEDFQKRLQSARDDFERLKVRVRDDAPNFLKEANAAAKRRGLKLDIDATHPPYAPGLNRSPVKIKVLNPEPKKPSPTSNWYGRMRDFTDWLAQNDQLVTANQFEMTGEGMGPTSLAIEGVLHVYVDHPKK